MFGEYNAGWSLGKQLSHGKHNSIKKITECHNIDEWVIFELNCLMIRRSKIYCITLAVTFCVFDIVISIHRWFGSPLLTLPAPSPSVSHRPNHHICQHHHHHYQLPELSFYYLFHYHGNGNGSKSGSGNGTDCSIRLDICDQLLLLLLFSDYYYHCYYHYCHYHCHHHYHHHYHHRYNHCIIIIIIVIFIIIAINIVFVMSSVCWH